MRRVADLLDVEELVALQLAAHVAATTPSMSRNKTRRPKRIKASYRVKGWRRLGPQFSRLHARCARALSPDVCKTNHNPHFVQRSTHLPFVRSRSYTASQPVSYPHSASTVSHSLTQSSLPRPLLDTPPFLSLPQPPHTASPEPTPTQPPPQGGLTPSISSTSVSSYAPPSGCDTATAAFAAGFLRGLGMTFATLVSIL